MNTTRDVDSMLVAGLADNLRAQRLLINTAVALMDGRPFDAEQAITFALTLDDHMDAREFLRAYNEGDWETVKEFVAENQPITNDKLSAVWKEGLPEPVLYTIREGGDWFAWPMRHTINGEQRRIHAVKFADGSIFDALNGWRPSVTIVAESK